MFSHYYYDDNGMTTSMLQSYRAGNKNASNSFAYSYDELKRVEGVTVTHDGTSYTESYTYAGNLKNNGYSSNLVSSKGYTLPGAADDLYEASYEYDRVGNIKRVITDEGDIKYFYDDQNQLVIESNGIVNMTWLYKYDTYGNIRERWAYGTSGISTPSDLDNAVILTVDTYDYNNAEWRDRLGGYNGVSFSYDAIGNPTSYNNGSAYSFTWQNGRQLYSSNVNGQAVYYAYNHDGLRTIKTVVGGERYLYYYSGDKLISMTWDDGGRSLNFLYNGASPYSVVYYDGTYSTSYYYITNLQGDVVAIMNAQHAVVARYVYDAWGNILAITDSNGSNISGNAAHIANLNPIRYRGYFYDTETGFYYLQSRYYDPVIGRFINADGYMSTGQGFSGCNMYSYCANNPVMFVDFRGTDCHIFEGGRYGPACYTDSTGFCRVCNKQECCLPDYKNTYPNLTEDQKVLISTIAAEATVTASGKPASSYSRQAMANVALNRVGQREWSRYTTVSEICQFTGFDGYGNANYQACMDYLNNRDGSNITYEKIIWDVMSACNCDITNGCQLYYTPAAMTNNTGVPNWNFNLLTEVDVYGVDPYYEGRFFKYK